MRTLGTTLITLAILLPACGGGDEPASGDASRGWRATSLAMGGMASQWQTEADVDGTVAADLVCPAGGRYVVEGVIVGENQFDVTVSFEGCNADGVTISGELSLAAEIEITETSTRMHFEYAGELTWSGAVEGTCGIDMVMDIATEEGGTDEVSMSGDICGYSADVIVSGG